LKTVGLIRYNPNKASWVIQCEPHVTMRLKRVFSKISKHSQGQHLLTDTVENARDLQWFIDRYPMELSAADLQLLRFRSQAHIEREGLIHRLLSNQAQPKDFELALPARDYQRLAATMATETGRLLLADDVGTGKTVSGICCLCEPKFRPALVVTLTHLPPQWKAEINRFAPDLRVHILKKGFPYNITKERGKDVGMPDVILTSYSKLRGWGETLAPIVKSVIFDEVQELRHQDSGKYSAAKYIADNCLLKLGASATPIYNYGNEFFSVLNVLAPGAVGSHEEFIREWCGYGGPKAKIKNPKAFGTWLREQGLMLRRTRQDVGRELPGLQKVHHIIDADLQELDKVSRSCAELARLILRDHQEKKGEKFLASEEFTNTLRQATGIAKAPFVADFVRLLVESGEKVVLYGWHRAVYDIWRDKLRDLNPAMYTGSESSTQKETAKQRFISGESKILIISLRAGAGLDGLQSVARTVVFGELDWSPGVHEQNIGRVYRDGQPEKVIAYFLVAESGADPIMAEVLGLKRQQSEPVNNPHMELVEELAIDGDHVKRLAEAYLQQISSS
jgi:SNF2 family DNA or RNA helicase